MQRVRRARLKRGFAKARLVVYCLLAVVAVPVAFIVGLGWLSSLG
jgi:hypothetical protein